MKLICIGLSICGNCFLDESGFQKMILCVFNQSVIVSHKTECDP